MSSYVSPPSMTNMHNEYISIYKYMTHSTKHDPMLNVYKLSSSFMHLGFSNSSIPQIVRDIPTTENINTTRAWRRRFFIKKHITLNTKVTTVNSTI